MSRSFRETNKQKRTNPRTGFGVDEGYQSEGRRFLKQTKTRHDRRVVKQQLANFR